MFKLPGNDGLQFDYATSHMFDMLWTLAIFGFIGVGLLIVMLICRWLAQGNKTQQKESVLQTEAANQSQEELIARPPSPATSFDVFGFVTSCLFYAVCLVGALMIGIIYGFDMLGHSIGNKVLTGGLTFLAGIVLHILWRWIRAPSNKEFVNRIKSLKGRVGIYYLILLLVWATGVAWMFYALHGICYCIFNDNYGPASLYGPQNMTYTMSTTLTRRGVFGVKLCPDGRICRVYATLPETTDTAVFINVHTGVGVTDMTVAMSSNGTNVSAKATSVFKPNFIEEYGQRKVWTFLFDNLNASTMYSLRLATSEHEILTRYKTLSKFGDIDTTLKVIIGGDVQLGPEGRQIFDVMSNESPDLLIVGGDIAYDNAMTYCFYSWDNFYGLVDKVNKINDTLNSRIVPFILALGNHDVGFNGLAKVYTFPTESGPWWFAYNPQHFDSMESRGIPSIQQRRSHLYHLIGPIALVTLDTGYIKTYEEQGKFIEDIASKYSKDNYVMMANYHVPIYPSCFHEDPTHFNSQAALDLSRQYLEPMFIKYKFKLCMENHVHKFKRTKAIGGVVYIGDGAFGVDSEDCPQQYRINSDLIATKQYVDSNHYWLGSVFSNKIELVAKSRHQGKEIDSTKIPFL